jgi:hypothetical protein
MDPVKRHLHPVMLRRAGSVVLLLAFGLFFAADAVAANERASARGDGPCCCCAAAEAPVGAVAAKLCCGMKCGKRKSETPATPASDGPQLPSAVLVTSACTRGTAEVDPAAAIEVPLAAAESELLRRNPPPRYLAHSTFLI